MLEAWDLVKKPSALESAQINGMFSQSRGTSWKRVVHGRNYAIWEVIDRERSPLGLSFQVHADAKCSGVTLLAEEVSDG